MWFCVRRLPTPLYLLSRPWEAVCTLAFCPGSLTCCLLLLLGGLCPMTFRDPLGVLALDSPRPWRCAGSGRPVLSRPCLSALVCVHSWGFPSSSQQILAPEKAGVFGERWRGTSHRRGNAASRCSGRVPSAPQACEGGELFPGFCPEAIGSQGHGLLGRKSPRGTARLGSRCWGGPARVLAGPPGLVCVVILNPSRGGCELSGGL